MAGFSGPLKGQKRTIFESRGKRVSFTNEEELQLRDDFLPRIFEILLGEFRVASLPTKTINFG